jgi:hypothetical protein
MTPDLLVYGWLREVELHMVFQEELYNFESLYKFIQRICTVFGTDIM